MILAMVLALELIRLTGPDNQRIELVPDSVVSVREPRGIEVGHFHQEIKCLLNTVDGKIVGVRERCYEVRAMLLHEKIEQQQEVPQK